MSKDWWKGVELKWNTLEEEEGKRYWGNKTHSINDKVQIEQVVGDQKDKGVWGRKKKDFRRKTDFDGCVKYGVIKPLEEIVCSKI